MTERWRKKLGDLDTQSPSDDVFERAKDGPTRGQDRFDDEPTSKRVFAGIAAIVVFGLAIAIFVVPFLRMGDQPADSDVTATLFPAWPSQTSDQLQQLQTQADRGDADWALDPAAVARKFGQDVMGWPNASAVQTFDPYCFEPSSSGTGAVQVPCDQLQVGGESVGAATVPRDFPRPSGSLDEKATKSYALFTCSACPKTASPEWVQLYQPLGRGDSAIWAVLQAQSGAGLSVDPGQIVHEGATVEATFYSDIGAPTLGYGSCGSSQATGDHHPSGYQESSARLSVQLGDTCAGAQAGYVWGAMSSQSLVSDSGVLDPLNGGGPPLINLTVVPVTMVFDGVAAQPSPSAPASPVLTMNPSPSMPGIGWGTHTDPYGWTIDVPKSWTTNNLTRQGVGTQGAEFVGDTMSVRVTTETAPKGSPPPGLSLPTNPDSSFPLDANALLQSKDGGLEGEFRGDGLLFSVRVSSPASPGQLSAADQAILDRMIGSITFQPWQVGEVRHDWVAIATPSEDISWINIEGGLYMLFRTADGYELYGSISCAGSDPTKTAATSDGFAKLTCPDGSTWEMDAGGASGGGGDAATNDPPPQWAVTTAHDGTLIAWVLPGVFPEGTGGSPSP
jgi:hypothetical protein